MKIDTSIILGYFDKESDYKNHWLFNNILNDGSYTFEQPSYVNYKKVVDLYFKTLDCLKNFIPNNIHLFEKLFPNYKNILDNCNVIIAVGCPSPYDAMTRDYNGETFIIFDLLQFLAYDEKNINSTITTLITHELVHLCINKDYDLKSENYETILKNTVFDEGFAHLLSFGFDITKYDFTKLIEVHYKPSLSKYQKSLSEKHYNSQEIYLQDADTGDFYNKFAAISGMLFLAQNINDITNIYHNGVESLYRSMNELI